jgi:hypothetical protein
MITWQRRPSVPARCLMGLYYEVSRTILSTALAKYSTLLVLRPAIPTHISILIVSQNMLTLTNSAVLGHVDMGIGSDLQNLLLGQASETEHADLIDDVVPVARGLQLVELGLESLAH